MKTNSRNCGLMVTASKRRQLQLGGAGVLRAWPIGTAANSVRNNRARLPDLM
jgi:hypothetical protein